MSGVAEALALTRDPLIRPAPPATSQGTHSVPLTPARGEGARALRYPRSVLDSPPGWGITGAALLDAQSPPMPARPSEDELIARYFAPLAGPAGLGLNDDVALIAPPAGRELVVTTDALVAGVHFFADDPADAIARKALRVNLSDLAAKGAEPIGFLLDLALPADWTAPWLEAFAAGLGEDAALYRCPLIGGDTVKTPGPLTIAITALGAVETGRMAARSGVRPGDRLYVRERSATPRSGCGCGWGRGRNSPKRIGAISSIAISCRSRAGAGAGDGAVRQRRHGRFRRLRRRSDQDAARQRRHGARRAARLPLSPAARAAIAADPRCSTLPRRAATTMNFSPRSRRRTAPRSKRRRRRPASR